MASESTVELDAVDWRILEHLQRDARIPVAELARQVGLGASATAERLRRLTDSGVVVGFRAELDLDRIGYSVLAFVPLRYPLGTTGRCAQSWNLCELLECHHVTGDDCFVLKVAARSMRHLEEITGRLATLGAVTTSVVHSTTVDSRVLTQPSP